MDYRVNSMQEAFELAIKFKEEGTYDLFRGQALDWEVISSSCRMSNDSFENNKVKLLHFFSFIENNDILSPYLGSENFNQVMGIAQHYGLGTNLIDFTTDPAIALYFATHDKSCEIGKESVIVCLNRKDFDDFNDILESSVSFFSKRNISKPHIVEINVPNLWRLNAQKGCFVHLQLLGYDIFTYHFDRIYFPYSEPFENIKETDIYPERKSPIEIELDKYFMNERMTDNEEWIKSIPNMSHIYDSGHSLDEYNIVFKNYASLPIHSSWDNNKWNDEIVVKWIYNQNRKKIQIDIKNLNCKTEYIKELSSMIEDNRHELIKFELINTINDNPNLLQKIEKLYDGMHILSYDSLLIAYAIEELIKIELKLKDVSNKLLIEFSESEGSGYYSRSYIFNFDLKKIIRDDIFEFINKKFIDCFIYDYHSNKISDKEVLYKVCSINSLTGIMPNQKDEFMEMIALHCLDLGFDVRKIFDFNKFVFYFAVRIIPFQIYLNRTPTLFNPSKIIKFGYA
jgi:hypothetical protein